MMKATLEKTLTPAYLNDRVQIHASDIAGHGLFAAGHIRTLELVAMCGGRLYTGATVREGGAELLRRVLRVEADLYLGPNELNNDPDPTLINHSCRPNCGLYGQIGLVALRDISPGEELTIDYAMAGSVLEDFDCRCGEDAVTGDPASGCRTRITSQDHLRPELRQRYAANLSPWLVSPARSVEHEDYQMQFEATGAWGLATQLDLHNCNPDTIRSAEKIREYTFELCDRIRVKRFGEPQIVHFGQDERVAGYSLVQLIETSLVSGHFANLTDRAYLDIFSCAYYNPSDVVTFSVDFFGARSHSINTNLRH